MMPTDERAYGMVEERGFTINNTSRVESKLVCVVATDDKGIKLVYYPAIDEFQLSYKVDELFTIFLGEAKEFSNVAYFYSCYTRLLKLIKDVSNI